MYFARRLARWLGFTRAPQPVAPKTRPQPKVFAWKALTGCQVMLTTEGMTPQDLRYFNHTELSKGELLDLEVLLQSARLRMQGRVLSSAWMAPGFTGEVALLPDADTRAQLERRLSA